MRRKGEWLLAEVYAAVFIHVSATRRVAAHWCFYGVPAAPPHLMATIHLEPEFCACSNATRRATSSSQQTREDACKSCDTYLYTERVKALIHTCPILEGTQTCTHVVYKKCAPPTYRIQRADPDTSLGHSSAATSVAATWPEESTARTLLSARRSTTKALRPMWEASQVQITDYKVAPQRGRP